MKKLFLLISTLISISVFGQFPNSFGISNSQTQYYVKGGMGADSSFIFRTAYADTTAANRGWQDAIPGCVIRTIGGYMWVRNDAATAWILISQGTGGGTPVDTTTWRVSGTGQTIVNSISGGGIGTANIVPLWLITSGAIRIQIPAGGITRQTAARYKTMLYDTIDHNLGYGDAGAATSLPISSLTAATQDNIINNGNYVQHWDWNSFTGDGVNGGLIVSSSSTAIVASDPLFNVTVDGALGSGVTSVAAKFNNAHTGTSSSNIAGWFESSGGTNNRAIIVPSGGGNVGIGTSTPAASSLLDITSTSKGFLAPRMTGAQQNAISSPATGLMIYNTDSSAYCYYTGSAWLKISQGGAGGGITSLNGLSGATQTFATGTSGTDFGISSVGTTHTFNIPTASGSNRGLLSTSDWTTFNSKVGGSGTANYVTYWNGTSTVTASDNFRFIDNLYYPTVYIGNSSIFEGALALKQGATSDYSYVTGQGGLSFSAPASNKSFNFIANNRQMFRLYDGTTGGTAQFSKTVITVDTAVGGPTLGSIHIEYNAGDSTSISTDVGRHEFRGIGRTYANNGSFNTFYSTVEAGNTTYDQDHIISWQSDAKKTGANTLTYIYHAGFLGDSINAGAVLHRWGVTMFDAVVRSGAILHEQAAIRVPKLRAAKSGQNYFALVDSSDYVQLGGKFSFGSDSSRTQDFNVTGTSYFNGNVGIGTSSPSARLHVISTTEQLRVGYDASNYYKTTVGSTGGVTFDAVGSGANFTFSDAVTLSNLPSGAVSDSVLTDASGAVRHRKVSDLISPYVTTGTYTPTLSNTTNVSASTAYQCQYSVAADASGNQVVTVSGEVDIDPTTTLTLTVLRVTLPITSNVGQTYEIGGTANDELGTPARISGNVANDVAEIRFTPVDVTNRTFSFVFVYKVNIP